jgi:cytochrome c oxidase subunit IV
MLAWCLVLFLLGVTAFLDSFFNYGRIFQTGNAILFMMVSLGLLVRVTYKMRSGRIEKVLEENARLKEQVRDVKGYKPPEPVSSPN